jgi:hypothetical protein
MDNQIQNKLSQFEVQPPEAVWQYLTDALDEKTLEALGNRLSQFEVLPQDHSWNSIAAQLGDTAPARIIPFHRKYAKPLKYASAVAIFTAVALIFNLMISKKTESEPTVQANVKKILNADQDRQREEVVTGSPVSDERDGAVAGISTYSTGGRSMVYAGARRKISDFTPTLGEPTAASVTVIPGCAERNTAIAFSKDADRYMAYRLENGSAIKLPKKMYDAITCPNKDINCLQKIKELQEKMAASTMLADFTGVLDMLDNLGENQ